MSQDQTSQENEHVTQEIYDTMTITDYGKDVRGDMLNKYVPTGISVKLNLPLVSTADFFLFGINLDGFIPFHSAVQTYNELAHQRWMQNFFPVQSTSAVMTTDPAMIEIYYRHGAQPSLIPYWGSRCISGNVGIGIRMSSNTTQTGNLFFAHKAALIRKYQRAALNKKYDGLIFSNDNKSLSTTYSKSFSIVDVSLQRHISIKTNSTKVIPFVDLPKKLLTVAEDDGVSNSLDIDQEVFREDWIMVGISSDLSSTETNQLNLEILFDYSDVTFSMPMLYALNEPLNLPINIGAYYQDAPTEGYFKSIKKVKSKEKGVKALVKV